VSHPAILERPEGSFLPRPECRVGAPLGGFSLGAFRGCWLLSFEYLYARTLGWSADPSSDKMHRNAVSTCRRSMTVRGSRLRFPTLLATRSYLCASVCARNNALGISAHKSAGRTYGAYVPLFGIICNNKQNPRPGAVLGLRL